MRRQLTFIGINILWMSFITSVDNSKLQDVKLQYQISATVLQVVELCEASFWMPHSFHSEANLQV